MKEEILINIREDLKKEKEQIKEHNEKIRRIKELQKNEYVKEYIKLLEDLPSNINIIKRSDKEIIRSIFESRYLNKISRYDTNGICVYMGTYRYSYDIDIEHGSKDIRVSRDDEDADYREYWDIEQYYSFHIPICQSNSFEKTHTIIKPNALLSTKKYYEIREYFIDSAAKTNQENAIKRVLKKYK